VALCNSTCAGILGTCYSNSGCGNGQECHCITCTTCFTDGDTNAACHGSTVSWKAPGASC
jgi:hypothetical protein